MSEKNTELIEYYKNLLIMQYRDKPKALAHIDNIVRSGMIYDIAIAVRDGFNLDTAKGKQLDVLGRILGPSRTITGTTFTRAYYGYMLYGDTAPFTFNPMLVYGAEAGDVQFRNYTEGQQSLYDLTDEEYRVILKLVVVRNSSNASVKSIDDILFVLFGAECYFIDRMNMTVVSYMVGAKWSRIFQIAKSSGLLPNPAGVGTALVVVPDINNIFAYSLYGGAKPAFAMGYFNYFLRWSIVGSEKTIILSGHYNVTNLTENSIVIVRSEANSLQAYSFDGNEWNASGNIFSPGSQNYFLSYLSQNSFVVAGETIQKYFFDGTNFSVVGNALQINESYIAVAGLSENRIAIVSNTNQTLRTYDFDGSNWELVGNPLHISCGQGSMSMLSSTRIVLFEDNSNNLRTYDFDGSNWALVGNELHIDHLFVSITTVTNNRIAFIDSTEGILKIYDFDEIDWKEYGNGLFIKNSSTFEMTRLKDNRISLIENSESVLQTYDLISNTKGCMASYS